MKNRMEIAVKHGWRKSRYHPKTGRYVWREVKGVGIVKLGYTPGGRFARIK